MSWFRKKEEAAPPLPAALTAQGYNAQAGAGGAGSAAQNAAVAALQENFVAYTEQVNGSEHNEMSARGGREEMMTAALRIGLSRSFCLRCPRCAVLRCAALCVCVCVFQRECCMLGQVHHEEGAGRHDHRRDCMRRSMRAQVAGQHRQDTTRNAEQSAASQRIHHASLLTLIPASVCRTKWPKCSKRRCSSNSRSHRSSNKRDTATAAAPRTRVIVLTRSLSSAHISQKIVQIEAVAVEFGFELPYACEQA